MNQGSFQNMGVPRPAQQGNPQPGGMQRNGAASSEIRSNIMRELSSRPIPTGWQQTVGPPNRVALIHQVITQLSLIKPEYSLQKTFEIATSFERGEFEQSPDRQTYEAHCRTQLKRIFDTRQNQAEQQQQFLNPQQPQMALMQQQMAMQGLNPNQFPQAYPFPQQAHMPNLGNPMQHHPAQNQRPMQPANPMEVPQQMANVQPVQNMAQRAHQNQGQPQFTQQEQQHIMRMAESMAQNVTQEQMNNVQRMVMNMSAEHRQQMQNQGQNPAHAIFRQQAIKRFLYERAAIQQQRAGQGPHAVDRGNAVSQPGRPTSQVPVHQGQQVPPGPTSQNHDPSFDQFLGQQQDALRHQEAGQVVVPASLGAPPQVRGTPHPQPQGQFGVRPMQHPTSFQPQPPTIWTTPQGQHPNIPQTPQSQGPAQTPNLVNMPGQTPHQQALQGQLGGLDNSRVQRTPQQNPNMPTLNRPLNPPSQAQGTQRQAQPTPKAGSKTGSGGQQTALASGQPSVGQQPASSLSQQQKLQRYIASLAEPQKSAFIARFKQAQVQRKAEEAGQSAAQTGPTGAPVAPMGGPGTKAQPGPKATPIAPNSSKNATNGLKAQAQTPQQPRLSNEGQAPQQKFAPTPLDSDAIRMMDRVEFPRGLLVLTGKNTKVPENIKQWGQLKQWVAQNSDTLPPGSIQKVAGLQSIVYQQKVAQNKQQREASNQSQPQGNTRPAQPGVAPAAQMVAPSNSQTSIQGSTTQVSNSLMPVLPPPTIHEVTAARAQLPAELKSTSDEYLRQMISHKRRQEYAKTMQGQNGLTPQQQQQQQQQQQMNNILRMQQHTNVQQAQGSMQPNQHSQSQPPQRTQNQKPPPGQQWPQPQTAQKSAQPNPQQAKQSQSNRPGPQAVGLQQNQKGGKRNNNNDDVIEVPDPKLSQQPARQPNIKGPQPQPPPSNAASQMTSEMYNSLPPEQKAHFQEQRRLHIEANQRAQAQRHSLNLQGQRLAEAVSQNAAPNAGRDSRMKELRNDVMKNMPARQPIPMSPNTRAKMIDKLRSVSAMSSRLESSLPLFLSLSKDEEKTKELLRSRVAVHQQLKENQSGDTNPVDNFTMSLEELNTIQAKLHEYFQYLMSAKIPKTGQNPPQQQQLSAANLQSQQEMLSKARVADLHKNHSTNSNRPPAAPTTSQPPFSFGGQSPQGVPQFYGPTKNELTQEKLQLPVTKKRRNNNNAASPSMSAQVPAPAAANKSSLFGKTDSAETQRTPAVPPMVKCHVANCETGTAGFSTKADLEKHIAETHEPKEPVIKDPLDAAAYAIESMRIALNLDENGRSKPLQEQKAEPMQAQAMKASLSAQGQSSVKQEATTPMSRNPTQTGPSPSSNLLKTPQAAANIKTPASDAKSTGKEIKATAPTKPPGVVAPDPWANSHVKPEWFKEVFSEVADLNRPVADDVIIDWLERNPFTPSTSPSSGAPSKDSPHKSDISANDTLNINVSGDDWLPPEWFDDGLPSDMAALDVADFTDMDWEATFEKLGEEEEEVLANGKRRRERDPLDPSDEWLKAWAPDKWEDVKKKDAGRKQ